MGNRSQLAPDPYGGPGREEAAVHAGEEEYQADEAYQDSLRHTEETAAAHPEQGELEYDQHEGQGAEHHRDFANGSGQDVEKRRGDAVGLRRQRHGRHVRGVSPREEPEDQHRQDGAYRRQPDEAEAVVLPVARPLHGGHSYPHRHYHRHRHRAGGGAPRVEGDPEVLGGGEEGDGEQGQVGAEDQVAVGCAPQDPAQPGGDVQAEAERYHQHEKAPGHGRGDRGHLVGQDVHVRLGDRGGEAYEKPASQQQGDVAPLQQLRPDQVPHGQDAYVRPYEKEGQTDDYEGPAGHALDQQRRAYRGDGRIEQ